VYLKSGLIRGVALGEMGLIKGRLSYFYIIPKSFLERNTLHNL
jgi:hypothetical protein